MTYATALFLAGASLILFNGWRYLVVWDTTTRIAVVWRPWMVRWGLALLGMGLIVFSIACASMPSSLSPQAQTAWHQHEVQKDLDLVRDLVQDASAQTPPVISIAAARQVTLWHRTAITLVHDQPAGWQQEITTGLDALKKNLSAEDYRYIARYVDLIRSVLKGLTS